ncbi:hypothetical protein DL770_011568 [Monosporascus sp. CRB-9-2]|nr:hypothetical protein DL770_011568 [Monosporascus sp. CRB-9-2]
MIEYCWINRQCRPPIQTRADFSRVVLTPEQKSQIVAPVQTVEFSRRRDNEEWHQAMAKSLLLSWKTYDYRKEALPSQEAEAVKRYYEGGRRVPPTPLRYDPTGRVTGGPAPTRNPKAGTKRFDVETDVSYRVLLLEDERQLIETRAKAKAEAETAAEAESAVIKDQVMSSKNLESVASKFQPEAVVNLIFPRLEAASQSLLGLTLAKIAENPLFASKVIRGIIALQNDIRAASSAVQPTSALNPIFAQLEAASQSLLDLVAANAAKSPLLVCSVIEGIAAFQNEIRASVVEAKGKENQEKAPGSSEIEPGNADKEQAVLSSESDSIEPDDILDRYAQLCLEEKELWKEAAAARDKGGAPGKDGQRQREK